MTTPQVRNVMFVVSFTEDNPLDDEGMLDFSLFPEYVKYCVYQLEVGAEGTEHFQGYMELSGKHSFKKLHLIPGLERAHFETRRGTAAQAITYCTKLDTRVSGPYHVGEPKEQGKRSDLLDVQVKILRGVSLKRVHDENFGTMIRYGKAIKEYKRTITKPRNFKSKVFLFIGPPGKGKSTLMKLIGQALGSFYKAPAPKGSGAYYDDYDGEDVFMMDEFDGSRMKPTDFNELCDEHEYVLPVHGSAGHQMVSKYIFIGSNYLPKQWWKNRNPHQLRQTTRRIDAVFKVGFEYPDIAPYPAAGPHSAVEAQIPHPPSVNKMLSLKEFALATSTSKFLNF